MSVSIFESNRKIDNNRPLNIDIDSPAYCLNELLQMDVPPEYQDDDFSCTPVCMKMVLEYVKKKFSEGFPNLDIAKISEILKTSADIGGTNFENIKNINEEFRKTKPSLEFVPSLNNKIEDIKEEIKCDQPVIAWTMMPDPNGDYPHSIVITDIDEDKLLIYYNDPVYGKETVPISQFMDMWNGNFRVLIKIRIGEKVTLNGYID
jgi:ABC-type bacteriocin/lantibiotic exporter with double-glycine peptidase domain